MKNLLATKVIGSEQKLQQLIGPNTAYNAGYVPTSNNITFRDLQKTLNVLGISKKEFEAGVQQEAGVQEGDVVKTDGNRIFYAPEGLRNLHVMRINANKKLSTENSIKLPFKVKEMYLTNDYVIVVGSKGKNGYLEVRDRESLAVEHRLEVDSDIVGHRLAGNSLVLITKKMYAERNKDLQPIYIENGREKHVAYDKLYYFVEEEKGSITLLYNLNLDTFESTAQGFLGEYSSTIYMNSENMFMAEGDYNLSNEKVYATRVLKFKINKENNTLDYKGVGLIDGILLNQYAMDEHNGQLRVVTSEQPWGKMTTQRHRLIVLEEDDTIDLLRAEAVIEKGIGKPGEDIKSVRFTKEMVYITTFKYTQRDPIYAIDLTDIENPKFKTAIVEDGFNTFLQPWDKTHFIGVGKPSNFRGDHGLKIAAYSVDSPKKPLHRLVLDDHTDYSYIHNNPSAMVFSKRTNTIGIPMPKGLQIINVDFNRKHVFAEGKVISHPDKMERGLVIEDAVYAISPRKVSVYDMTKSRVIDSKILK